MSKTTIVLKLLGRPRLYLNDAEFHIAPRATFELLALVLMSGSAGISRKSATMKLWSHLDGKNASGQLRFNVMRLREQLEERNVLHLFTLDGPVLKANCVVTVDTIAAQDEVPSAHRLPELVQPIADGWKPERWTDVTDTHAELLHRWLTILASQVELSCVKKATDLYPSNLNLARHFVGRLRAEAREAEASEAIIRFEEAWVERFGTGDIPDAQTHHNSISTPSVSERGNKKFRHAGLAGILALVAVAVPFSFVQRNAPQGSVSISNSGSQMWLGRKVQRYTVTCTRTGILGAKILSSGRVVLGMLDVGGKRYDLAFAPGQTPVPVLVPPDLSDENQDQRLMTHDGEKGSHLEVKQAGRRLLERRGVPSLPKVSGIRLFNNSLLYHVRCNHPEGCHLQIWYEDAKGRVQVTTPAEPPRVAWAIAKNNFVGSRMYVNYSMGSSDKWRYRCGYLDFGGGRLNTPLIHELAVDSTIEAASDEGSVVLNRTTTTVADGDYRTKDSNVRSLLRPDGTSKPLLVEGTVDFESICGFGAGYIVVLQQSPGVFIMRGLTSDGGATALPAGMESKLNGFLATNNSRLVVSRSFSDTNRVDIWVISND
jgi:hypothetical protein